MPGKILIVEDTPDFRRILVFVLSPSYEVIEAESGEEGIEKALVEAPDLIIMDLGLPGINGIDATARLKQNPQTAHIPVVAYTAWAEDLKDRAIEAGMAEFLSKTTPTEVLKKVIDKFLEARP